jgi:hypothetical protein
MVNCQSGGRKVPGDDRIKHRAQECLYALRPPSGSEEEEEKKGTIGHVCYLARRALISPNGTLFFLQPPPSIVNL